jgi:signal transduction histidine kinase/CheY-like chemotaxis protein
LRVELAEGRPADEVKRWRAEVGGAPIGVVCATHPTAIDAILAGADEAMVVHSHDPSQYHDLVDRTLLRAKQRKEIERNQSAIAHADKLSALGTLVAGVAHEISNPLATIDLTAEILQAGFLPIQDAMDVLSRLVRQGRAASPEELADMLERMKRGATLPELNGMLADLAYASRAATSVVGDLKLFSRAHGDEAQQLIHLSGFLDQVVRLVEPQIREFGVIERDYGPNLPAVIAPKARLAQVVMNVLINASHAIQEIARDFHRVRITTRADDEAVVVSISDSGPGIPPDIMDQIFDPFFTTKREQLGTGLGLSISRAIMQSLGGDLLVDSIYGEGATFLITVPLPAAAAVAEAEKRRRRITPHQHRLGVLIVDEDPRLLRAYSRALSPIHNVIIATDGREAADLLSSGSEVDVVISELVLPELDGKGLLEWLGGNRPDLVNRTVFITGHDQAQPYQRFLEDTGREVLIKPVQRAALMEAIERAARRSA